VFRNFAASWQLVKASWAVLQSDKELLWFPIMSSIALIVVSLLLLVPSGVVAFSMAQSETNQEQMQIFGVVGMFVFYFVSYTVMIYFNTGLVGAAMIRLDGGDPTVADGFRAANSRLGKIFGYAAISATVGMILRIIEERSGIIGDIVAGIIGTVWNVATFLVIPVLVSTDMGPIEAVKHSASLLKKTWGEQITGNFSMGGIFFLIYLALIVVGGLLIAAIGSLTSSGALVGVLVVVIVIAVLVIATIQGALSGIYQATLYRYAELGVAPDNFDIETIQGAFKPKRKRGIV
jgi:Family of unknown function (DUF6159)